MSEADAYADWLVANQKKKGTPEYEAVAAAFREVEQEEAQKAEPSFLEAVKTGASRLIPQAKEIVRSIPDTISGIPSAIQRTFDPVNIAMGRSPVFQTETYGAIARAPVERYGTTARAKETIATDPLGALMDVSLVGSAAGTALRQIPKTAKLGEMLEKGAQVVDPLTLASRVVTKVPREVLKFRLGAPSKQELREFADAAYLESEQAGAVFKPARYNDLADDISWNTDVNPALHPNAAAALTEVERFRNVPLSLKRLDEVRQAVSKSIKPMSSQGDIAKTLEIRDKIDDFIENASAKDIVAGDVDTAVDALTKARSFWSQMRKAEKLDELLEKADVSAAGYTASGAENAIRARIRTFVNNPKNLRGFKAEEVAALKDIAKGGSITNALRALGRFTPTGPVSAIPAGSLALADPMTGAMFAGTALAGRLGATAGTQYAAQQAGQLIRGGQTYSQKLADFLKNNQKIKQFLKNDKKVKQLLQKNPKLQTAVDDAKSFIAAGKKVDPYYARQLAAQLARIEAEEQEQGQ